MVLEEGCWQLNAGTTVESVSVGLQMFIVKPLSGNSFINYVSTHPDIIISGFRAEGVMDSLNMDWLPICHVKLSCCKPYEHNKISCMEEKGVSPNLHKLISARISTFMTPYLLDVATQAYLTSCIYSYTMECHIFWTTLHCVGNCTQTGTHVSCNQKQSTYKLHSFKT